MTRFKVSFDGVMDWLEELERENHRLQAENAVMRAVVEAVAELGKFNDVCLCWNDETTASDWLAAGSVHRADCRYKQARTFLASQQAAESEPTP